MRSANDKQNAPSLSELRRFVGRQRSLGDLIDFTDRIADDAVRPTLTLMCSLLPANGSGEEVHLRVWALFGALITRYLFSVVKIPEGRDTPL